MTDSKLSVVQELWRAFDAIDPGSITNYFAPDVIMHAPEGWPEPGPMVGRDDVIAQFERLAADWRSHSTSIEESEEGPDHVVVRGMWRATGAVGVVHELAFFWDHEQAREAARRGPTGLGDAPDR